MRLSRRALHGLPAAIERPRYDPAAITTGIVHFGPGAFHRAHQAAFIDRLLGDDPRWGIAEVSLRSGRVTADLAAQDGLYTLSILDVAPSLRVIGAVTETIGPGEGARLLARLTDPAVRIVTSTVTEKGYCLAGDLTLDRSHPDIVHDFAHRDAPRSLTGWLVRGLAARRTAGMPPFTVIPCDNLPGNGALIRAATLAHAAEFDAGLADWIGGEAVFAGTMVDSITPASDAALLLRVKAATGFDDAAAVQREGFAQWVIEDVLPPGGPDLRRVGVELSSDVASHERAKLRILNGAHSALAYIGLLRGHATVAAAMGDPLLTKFIEVLVREDIIPGVGGGSIDLHAYASTVLARFRNPAIAHQLVQIAGDGSQKLPYRLLAPLADARAAGRRIDRLALPIAAWLRGFANGANYADPLAGVLNAATRNEETMAARALAIAQVFGADLAGDTHFAVALARTLAATRNPASLDAQIASLI